MTREKGGPLPEEASKKEVSKPTEEELDQRARELFDFHLANANKAFEPHESKDRAENLKYWMLNAIGDLRNSASHPEKNEQILSYYKGYQSEDLNLLADKLEKLWKEKQTEDEEAKKAIEKVVSESE